MMESLIAFCVVLLIAAGVIVALGMAVECLRRLACHRSPAPAGSHRTPSATTRDRPETWAARRRRKAWAGYRAALPNVLPDLSRKARVPRPTDVGPDSTFVRKPTAKPPLVASWRGKRDRTEMDRAPLLAFLRMFPQPR
jgi:hypothetical protein